MPNNMNEELNKINVLIGEWNVIKSELETLYHNRDVKGTPSLMEKGIELFIHFLLFSNGQVESSRLSGWANSLKYKPINVEERLTFIQSRPSLYQSFRQLSELMVEQEKIYVKLMLKRKASSLRKD
jgi:hypothetical protein